MDEWLEAKMAYDKDLAKKVWDLLDNQPGIEEKRMFGGVGYLLNGNMACGVHGSGLIVRMAPEDSERALLQPGVRVFDLSGRPMKGWITVDAASVEDDTSLQEWVERGLEYARGLPAKIKGQPG